MWAFKSGSRCKKIPYNVDKMFGTLCIIHIVL